MLKIKKVILNKLHKGNDIIYHKRSRQHPMLNKRYFHDTYGYCVVDRVWNIKDYCKHASGFRYEADDRIKWNWKIRILTDIGIYILPLYDFIPHATHENGKKISDNDIYLFYK